MKNLFGMTLPELKTLMMDLGEPAFRAGQLSDWIYDKKAAAVDDCLNLSKVLRKKISEACVIDHGKIIKKQEDPEDGTRKYLIAFSDGNCVESVLMSYHHGYSACISSQVGCAMGCAFCASTKGGLVRNLTGGEMLDQIYLMEQAEGVRIANVVIMGMGEPLHNYDNLLRFITLANDYWGIGQRKITVSTCGLIPQMEKLAELNLQINLAVSLHSPFQDKRAEIMPIAKRYCIKDLFKTCKIYYNSTHRRITFEYALIQNFNDRPQDIAELCALFGDNNYHINLIRLNPISDGVYKGSKNVNIFSDALQKKGVKCTIRRRIGSNIDAACGQLKQNSISTDV